MSRYPALIAAAAALFAMSPALAQQDPSADYPNRPVKIIVSVPAGGGVDTVTRTFAKANPDKITFASQGPGTSSHLTAELFMKLTGTKMLHVPYRGTGPALNDLVAGHVDFIFMELASAYKLHEGGKSRILAVATNQRLDLLPDIPTLIELGVPGFLSDTWNAISAPPKTPTPIVSKLNRTINEILNEAATKARFRDLQLSAGGGSPQDMAKLKHDETERWTKVIREAGIQPE